MPISSWDATRLDPVLESTGTGGEPVTLNNYGVCGVDGSAATISHPEAGDLGFVRIIGEPWGISGELTFRKVTELTLTFDHCVCDGGTAGGFLRHVAMRSRTQGRRSQTCEG